MSADNPGRISVSAVAALRSLQEGINTDLGSLLLVIGGVILVLSALTAGATMFLSVQHRQAEIALRGQSVGVTLWAERKGMAEAARAEIGALHKALTGAAFEVVNLEVKDGFPHLVAQRHAPVLDKRT